MKKKWSKLIIFVILVLSANGLLAQITMIKLDHVQLMKQFLGNWNAELGKDSVGTLICKSFYNGFDFYFKIEVKGKTVFEEKTLSGYDKKYDKLIKIWIQNTDPEFGILHYGSQHPQDVKKFCLKILTILLLQNINGYLTLNPLIY